MLWKNVLLKRTNFLGTLAEICLPVLFMALLIILKNISTLDTSPNIAYYCGQSFPWFYTSYGNISVDSSNLGQVLLQCLKLPDTCEAQQYYQYPLSASYVIQGYLKTFTAYAQYGAPFFLNHLNMQFCKPIPDRFYRIWDIWWKVEQSILYLHCC